jgi:flagellar protein FliL
METEATDVPPAPKPRKKGGLMTKLVMVTLFLLVAGGGAAWWLTGSSATAAAEPGAPSIETRGVFAFEPFLVNLADQGGNRFLKATIQIVLESPEAAHYLDATPVLVVHARSAILEVLTQQSAPALVTPDGKNALKQAIRERTAPLLTPHKVLDVLFSEFVVQF